MERQKLYFVDGVPKVSKMFEYSEEIRNIKAKPEDVLIATYPKAGVDLLETTPSPRIVKTHLPMQLVPASFWESDCKMISLMPELGSWEEFFESYLAGNDGALIFPESSGRVPTKEVVPVAWGSWFDHVIGRWDIRERHQVLFVFYEDIVQDPMREVERVVRYLGKTLDRTTTDEIVEHIAFGNKRDNPMTNFFMNQEITPFMRKVKVGDWKNHFTVTQNERFEEEYQQRMAKTSLRFTDEL